MNGQVVLAGLLLLAGVGLLVAAGREPSLHDRLREIDGEAVQDTSRLRRTVFGAAFTAGLVALPFLLWSEGVAWPVVAVVAFLVAGVVAVMAVELRVRLRGRGTAVTVPLTFRAQRRLASRLLGALMALWPVPPLRPAPRPRADRPTAPVSSRSSTLLLVVRLPADAPGLRLWDIAEQYLGSRLRYRDLITLNRYRTTPDGVPVSEDSIIHNGWTLLVPGDARGPGLVVLPADATSRGGSAERARADGGTSSAVVPAAAGTADRGPAPDGAGQDAGRGARPRDAVVELDLDDVVRGGTVPAATGSTRAGGAGDDVRDTGAVPRAPAPHPAPSRPAAARPSPSSAPAPTAPSTTQQPAVPAQPAARPAVPAQPAARPAVPAQPAARPAVPAQPAARPAVPAQPAARPPAPQRPATRPAASERPVAQPSVPAQPAARPAVPQPAVANGASARPPASERPAARPAVSGQPAARPAVSGQPAARPAVPAQPAARPAVPAQPAARPPAPERPATRPARPAAPQPAVANGASTRAAVPGRPAVGQPAAARGPVAQPAVAAQPVPSGGPVAQPAVAGGSTAPGGPVAPPPAAERPVAPRPAYPRSPVPWDLVHARLLADGVLDTVASLRERRRDLRPTGSNVPLPDAAAVRVEEAAHIGADTEAVDFLELALRQFAAGCAGRDAPWPSLVAAHLGPDRLELRLATPDREPPPPFEASRSGSTWMLDRAMRLDDAPDVAPRLPGLVSLGPDSFGRLLVNLPAGEVISLTGPDEGCRLVAVALAIELVLKRWSEAPLVNLVGFGDGLAALSPRLRCTDRISHVLDRPVRGDVVILAEPPSDAALTALRVGAGSDWFGAPAVVVVGEHRRARWHLELSGEGMLSCSELDFTVGAQALAVPTALALSRLLATERATELPGVASSTVLLPRRVEPELTEVVLHLFGRPRLTRGADVVAASDRSVEIVAFLALLGATSVEDLATALWPHGVDQFTVHAELHEVAATLGESVRGEPLLRVGEVVELAPEVQLDWHLVVAAAAVGADASALTLVGPSAADDIERGLHHYPWMARSPLVRQLPGYVADIALRHDHHRRESAARNRSGPDATRDGAGRVDGGPGAPLVRV